jgi:ABC-type nickel/cobalt efflux system permease component RcnA
MIHKTTIRIMRLILLVLVMMGVFWAVNTRAQAQTAGHASDLVKNQGLQSLLAHASTQSTDIQRAAILTHTHPAAFLLWDEGVAIVLEAQELVDAGFRFGSAPAGFVFDKVSQRILITRDDWTSLNKPVQSKAAVFAHFLLNRPHLISYNATTAQFLVSVGAGYVMWSNIFEEPDHDDHTGHDHGSTQGCNHNHAELIPLIGQRPQLTLVLDATPFIKRGLNPKKLKNFTYTEEPSGFLGLFRRRSLTITFTS